VSRRPPLLDSIAQFPAYIEEQLKLFRSGDRANSQPMHDIALRMTDDDIKAVADYAAGLR
jgi:cytochrome c553